MNEIHYYNKETCRVINGREETKLSYRRYIYICTFANDLNIQVGAFQNKVSTIYINKLAWATKVWCIKYEAL